MNKPLLGAAILLFCAIVSVSAQSSGFSLRSPDIKPGSTIASEFVFNSFGCSGKNISPALGWSGAPQNTKSFALIVHDPDAQTGVGGFTHWIVYNIPANTSSLAQGAGTADGKRLPTGATQSATSFGTSGWGGPCPPAGEKPHRYVFTLYALSAEKLELPASTSQAFVGFNIVGNTIAKTNFTALYGR
jgi:Raf kinase inhibitor-like YbhB/YbcL family protein